MNRTFLIVWAIAQLTVSTSAHAQTCGVTCNANAVLPSYSAPRGFLNFSFPRNLPQSKVVQNSYDVIWTGAYPIASQPPLEGLGGIEYYYALSGYLSRFTVRQTLWSYFDFGAEHSAYAYVCTSNPVTRKRDVWRWGDIGNQLNYASRYEDSRDQFITSSSTCNGVNAQVSSTIGYLVPPSQAIGYELTHPNEQLQPVLTCARYSAVAAGTWPGDFEIDGKNCDMPIFAGFSPALFQGVTHTYWQGKATAFSSPDTRMVSYRIGGRGTLSVDYLLNPFSDYPTQYTWPSSWSYAHLAFVASNGVLTVGNSRDPRYRTSIPCTLVGAGFDMSTTDSLVGRPLSQSDLCSLANVVYRKDFARLP